MCLVDLGLAIQAVNSRLMAMVRFREHHSLSVLTTKQWLHMICLFSQIQVCMVDINQIISMVYLFMTKLIQQAIVYRL